MKARWASHPPSLSTTLLRTKGSVGSLQSQRPSTPNPATYPISLGVGPMSWPQRSSRTSLFLLRLQLLSSHPTLSSSRPVFALVPNSVLPQGLCTCSSRPPFPQAYRPVSAPQGCRPPSTCISFPCFSASQPSPYSNPRVLFVVCVLTNASYRRAGVFLLFPWEGPWG